jgi:hypothetical protein
LILQITVFVALCEGYLGIKPNFTLWKYYFCTTVFYNKVKKGETVPVCICSYAIQLRQSYADEYISMKGMPSNKGWHQKWFYPSDTDAPLPPYTGRYFEVAPTHWGYGPITTKKEKINTLLQAVKRLVNHGVSRARVIATFHEWRVLSLMQRARRLDEMVSDAPLKGIVLMMEDLNRDEIKKRVKLVLGSIPSDATLDLHSPMHPNDDFIEMVSALHPLRFFVLHFCHLTWCSGVHRGAFVSFTISTLHFPRTWPEWRGTGPMPQEGEIEEV